MKYETCPKCGSNLDHGEVCECEREVKENEKESGDSKRRISYVQESISGLEIQKDLE